MTPVWSGRPRRHPLRFADLFLIFVGGWWTAGWAALTVVGPPGTPPLPVMILLGVLGELWWLGPVWFDQRRLRSTRYLLTEHTLTAVSRYGQRSAELEHLPEPVFKRRPDGTGTIRFGRRDYIVELRQVHPLRWWRVPLAVRMELRGIPDVQEVYDLVVRLRQARTP